MENLHDAALTRRDLFIVGAASASAVGANAATGGESGTPKSALPPAGAEAVMSVAMTINGRRETLSLDTRTTLLDALREHLHLTGTKKGCDHGQCGACTVIVDGRRINACLTLAVMHEGAQVTTIEGLGSPQKLHAMQAAFVRHDGYQCGYCTPGQICSARGLIAEGRATSRDEVREAMSGNLCRCGAYTNITDAVMSVLALESGTGAAK